MSADTTAAARAAPAIPSLQWLRAAAAVMVVVFHAEYHANVLRAQAGEPASHLLGFAAWGFGVHLFFVISGFIMVHTTRGFGVPGGWRLFLLRRAVRVVPLYWLATTLMVAIVVVSPSAIDLTTGRLRYFVMSYLFVPVLRSEGDLRPVLGQGWTLTYEVFFYAAFALAMLLPRRRGLAALTIGFSALAWFGRDLTPAQPVLFTWTNGLLLEFLFGAALGLAFGTGRRMPAWAAGITAAAGLALLVLDGEDPRFVVSGASAALIVAACTLGPRLRDGRATRWLTLIGDSSYALYLSHTFVLRPIRLAWSSVHADRMPATFYLLAAVAAAIAIGLVVHRLIERPMTARLGAWLLPGRPPVRAAPALSVQPAS